jgi:hypothetical protein
MSPRPQIQILGVPFPKVATRPTAERHELASAGRLGPLAGKPAAASHPLLNLQRAAGNQAVQRMLRQARAAPRRGPRPAGADPEGPFRGPAVTQRRLGTSTANGCVRSPLSVNAAGGLRGGYEVNDYLANGMSWGAVGSPGTAGRDGHGHKVQVHATFSNAESLGVAQTMTHGGSNQAFLDGTAGYLGMAPGSVANGTTFNEPVLNAGDPYDTATGWNLQYGPKTGGLGRFVRNTFKTLTGSGEGSLVSFVDVPRAGPGEKGYIDFRTTFFSRGGGCTAASESRTWRWNIDFTGTNDVNTVT